MNIKKALKEKNKLAKKITDLLERTNRFNSMDEGAVRSYDPNQSLEQAVDTMEKLISLKTQVHIANTMVFEKIFRMAEYKSFVKYLKSLNCTEGTMVQRSYGDTTTRHMTTVITEVQRDQMVENYETIIDQLQSDLDIYNATTFLVK